MATIPPPDSWSVSTVFPYKDLEGARMQPRHFMPEWQAQVAGLSHVAQRQDKTRYSSFFAFGVRDGKVLPSCKRKSS